MPAQDVGCFLVGEKVLSGILRIPVSMGVEPALYRMWSMWQGYRRGVYRPNDAVYRKKSRGIFEDSVESSTYPNTFTDKVLSKVQEKYLDKIAESIVNPVSLSYERIPMKMNLSLVPRIRNFSFVSEDVFGIEGYMCRSCLMIKPAILTYSSNPKRQTESMNIIHLDSCVTCSTQMSAEERSYYLNYNLTNGITPILFRWIREYWSDFDRLKLIARRISSLKIESPGYDPNVVNFRTTNSSPSKITHLTIACQRNLPPSIRRAVSLKLDELRVIELKTLSSENSD